MLLLTFRAAENLYAVEVTRVVEVVPRVELRRLPHSPPYLAGLFDYRGSVVPVVDLGSLLGSAACPERLSTRIILIELARGGLRLQPDPVLEQGEAHAPVGEAHKPRADQHAAGRRQFVGLIAEQVSDVASIQAEQVISPPMQLPQAPYLGAIVEIGQEMTQLLEVDHVLEQSFRDAFFRPEVDADQPFRKHRDVTVGSP